MSPRPRKALFGLAAASLCTALLNPGVAVAAPGDPGKPVATGKPGVTGPRCSAGADGVGDPYVPYSGNGGYDVPHYHLPRRLLPR